MKITIENDSHLTSFTYQRVLLIAIINKFDFSTGPQVYCFSKKLRQFLIWIQDIIGF
jgi:hypothetical protein